MDTTDAMLELVDRASERLCRVYEFSPATSAQCVALFRSMAAEHGDGPAKRLIWLLLMHAEVEEARRQGRRASRTAQEEGSCPAS